MGTWGQDRKGRSLTTKSKIVFFYIRDKKNRLSMTKGEIIFFKLRNKKSIKPPKKKLNNTLDVID
jgi:hypothetical protein